MIQKGDATGQQCQVLREEISLFFQWKYFREICFSYPFNVFLNIVAQHRITTPIPFLMPDTAKGKRATLIFLRETCNYVCACWQAVEFSHNPAGSAGGLRSSRGSDLYWWHPAVNVWDFHWSGLSLRTQGSRGICGVGLAALGKWARPFI